MKTPERSPQKVVVIGAGPGGLASAMMLAKAGFDVTVIERQARVGGRTSTINTENGFKFDVGPTFFLYPRVLEEIFTSCGKNLKREVPMVRLDPQYRLIFGAGGQLDCTPDMKRMEKNISTLAPNDAPAMRRFMDDNKRKLAGFRKVLESPFNGWTDLLKPSLLPVLPLLRPHRALMDDISTYFKDPRVRLSFTFQAKYLGMSPYKCPSLFSILSYLEYENGVWHPMGGCGAVSDAMARIAQEMGVKIKLNEPVKEIVFKGRKAVGVKTEAAEYKCDSLIVNADFAHAMSKLVPNNLRKRWTDEKLAKKRYSCSTFMLYLGVDGDCNELAHHSIYIAKEYEKNLDDIENAHKLTADPSFYVQNACVTDPGQAPKGQTALYVLLPVTHQHPNVDWNKEAPAFRALALKQLEKLGLKNIEKRTRYEKMLTPNNWEHDFGIYKGATFNLAHNFGQMLHLRPRNRFEDLEGVYIVGGGTHPGSGLPVIYEGARISSRLMLQDYGYSTEFLDAPMREPAPAMGVQSEMDAEPAM